MVWCVVQEFTADEQVVLVQYAIKKFEAEDTILEKLGAIMDPKTIQRTLDTLIGTQRVRRIGPEILQNNESHTELPDLPDSLKPIIDQL